MSTIIPGLNAGNQGGMQSISSIAHQKYICVCVPLYGVMRFPGDQLWQEVVFITVCNSWSPLWNALLWLIASPDAWYRVQLLCRCIDIFFFRKMKAQFVLTYCKTSFSQKFCMIVLISKSYPADQVDVLFPARNFVSYTDLLSYPPLLMPKTQCKLPFCSQAEHTKCSNFLYYIIYFYCVPLFFPMILNPPIVFSCLC